MKNFDCIDLNDANKVCTTLTEQEHKDVDCLSLENLVFLDVRYYKYMPVAFIAVKEDLSQGYKDCYIIIAVSPQFRNKGIATKLVKSAITWFECSDYDSLFWPCDVNNAASNALAQKNNFVFAWQKDEGKSNVYVIDK